ncbi:hypothetical protein ACFWY9_34925 [Amycolatopsis sp. NPDC059027]|uniref:hypothetical protein n=1 Tax=unclassified Amycolatopsis TaxID=2618356 RepID=UPI00366BA0D6
MKRSAALVAFAAAGFLAAAPAAFATDSPTSTTTPATPTAPTSPTSSPTTTPTSPTTTATTSTTPTTPPGNPKAFLKLQPNAAHAGDKITVLVGCEAKYIKNLSSPVLDFGALSPSGPQDDPAKAPVSRGQATVKKDAEPGEYPASFQCDTGKVSVTFTVLGAKQVTQVPSGAPQTGGGDMPGRDNGPFVAAGALGVLAVGAAGCVLYRRRRED